MASAPFPPVPQKTLETSYTRLHVELLLLIMIHSDPSIYIGLPTSTMCLPRPLCFCMTISSPSRYFDLSTTGRPTDGSRAFQQERMYIWKQRKRAATFLFFIFRYVTPIVCLINLIAEHDPRWTGRVCSNWIWLPVAMVPIVNAATGGMFLRQIFDAPPALMLRIVILSTRAVLAS
jgi:hypothetical protein